MDFTLDLMTDPMTDRDNSPSNHKRFSTANLISSA